MNPQVYALVFWTYVASCVHFGSESFGYGTMKVRAFGALLGFLIDVGGLVALWWMGGDLLVERRMILQSSVAFV